MVKYFVIIGTEDGGCCPLYEKSEDDGMRMKLFDSVERIDEIMKNVPTTWGFEIYSWGC